MSFKKSNSAGQMILDAVENFDRISAPEHARQGARRLKPEPDQRVD
jgi:hypothetical protein